MVEQGTNQLYFYEGIGIVISKIPISCCQQKDIQIWRGTNTWEFFVRSAYHLEKDRHDVLKVESSRQSSEIDIWRVIWQLKIHNVEKIFMWKACHNLLSTKDNL
jgi:hypothetical protein